MKSKSTFSFLVNPFNRIAGGKALAIGLVVVMLTTLLGQLNGVIFDGVLNVHLVSVTMTQAVIMQGISLLSLIVFMYLSGKIFSASSIRFIDVAGTMSLSRFPFLLISLMTIFSGVSASINEVVQSLYLQSFASIGFSVWLIFGLSIAVFIIVAIWFIVLAYNGFSVSCNIKGAKNGIVFAVSFIIAEVVSILAIMLLYSALYTPLLNEAARNPPMIEVQSDFKNIEKIAIQTSVSIVEGDFEKTTSDFDNLMKESLPAEKLKEILDEMEIRFGKMKQIDEANIKHATTGNFRFIIVPVHFEKMVLNFRFTFDEKDKIAGFYM